MESASSNIVDLTGDDDLKPLRTAAFNAHVAASRLADQFQGLGPHLKNVISDDVESIKRIHSQQNSAEQPRDKQKIGEPEAGMENPDDATALHRYNMGPIVIGPGLQEFLSGPTQWQSNPEILPQRTPNTAMFTPSVERTPRAAALSARRCFVGTDWTKERSASPESRPWQLQAKKITPKKRRTPCENIVEGSATFKTRNDEDSPRKRGRPRKSESTTPLFPLNTYSASKSNPYSPSTNLGISPTTPPKRKNSSSPRYYDLQSKVAKDKAGSLSLLESVCQAKPLLKLRENCRVFELFKAEVYPAIQCAKERYEGKLPEENLLCIGLNVAIDLVGPDSAVFYSMAGCSYTPDFYQKKVIRRFVHENFTKYVQRETKCVPNHTGHLASSRSPIRTKSASMLSGALTECIVGQETNSPSELASEKIAEDKSMLKSKPDKLLSPSQVTQAPSSEITSSAMRMARPFQQPGDQKQWVEHSQRSALRLSPRQSEVSGLSKPTGYIKAAPWSSIEQPNVNDRLVHVLAENASSDPALHTLITLIAAGEASPNQFMALEDQLDELLAKQDRSASLVSKDDQVPLASTKRVMDNGDENSENLFTSAYQDQRIGSLTHPAGGVENRVSLKSDRDIQLCRAQPAQRKNADSGDPRLGTLLETSKSHKSGFGSERTQQQNYSQVHSNEETPVLFIPPTSVRISDSAASETSQAFAKRERARKFSGSITEKKCATEFAVTQPDREEGKVVVWTQSDDCDTVQTVKPSVFPQKVNENTSLSRRRRLLKNEKPEVTKRGIQDLYDLQIQQTGIDRKYDETSMNIGGSVRETESAGLRNDDTNPLSTNCVPFRRYSPSTSSDPHLERLVADLIIHKPKLQGPFSDGERCSVTYADHVQLVDHGDVFKYVDYKAMKPSFFRIESKIIDPARRPERNLSSLLRHRELGTDCRGRNVATHCELGIRMSERIEPWRHWKGASGDIVAVAWGPDSATFAAGAAAHTNIEDIQYNRPCNLLLGQLSTNTLHELPNHRVDRPKPETIPNGPNATQAVYDACDPMVYKTVSSIAFAPTGSRMFTASHDRTVKIWDTSRRQHGCIFTLPHSSEVTSVEISPYASGLFATASKSIKDAIRIYYLDNLEESALLHSSFSSTRAEARPDWRIYPECLRWGTTPSTGHLLLAGFQSWTEHDGNGPAPQGQLCLWDAHAFESIKVSPSSQSVFTAAWHPSLPFFATGGAPGGGLLSDRFKTKSVVRSWDLRSPKHYTMEYECSALDMQDITFSPLDSNIVTAGCTDGTSFVWDFRRPDHPIHRLVHDRPLVDWDHAKAREEGDTGVMMSLWGLGGTLFYTGSSDGMIKAWDVRRHPEDVLVRNVAQLPAGIQSGSFSPDGTHLLVGDADGGVHVLSSAPCGPRVTSDCSDEEGAEESINLRRAPDESGMRFEDTGDDNSGNEGRQAAKELIESGQLEYHEAFGVGKGPNYQGPYAKYARKEATLLDPGRLRSAFARLQPFSRKGRKRESIAEKVQTLIEERKFAIQLAQVLVVGKPLKMEQDAEQAALLTYGKNKCSNQLARNPTNKTLHVIDPVDEQTPNEQQNVLKSNVPNSLKRSSGTYSQESLQGAKDNTISERKMVEENNWWPALGEEEITRARQSVR